jgi:predicted RNA methylase
MNPPFGTKNNEGVDVKLLSAAINVSDILVK